MSTESTIPLGCCHCGCGQRTKIATVTSRRDGTVNGQPLRYLKGHNRAKKPVSAVWYLEDPDTCCWVWQRSLDGKGYGQIRVNGRLRPAHRFVYEREHGPVAAGLDLDHLCCNRRCVNPDHLEPVTHAENVQRGPRIKLTPDDVREIRRRHAAGERCVDLAREFGVKNVSRIVKRRAWRSVI